jgi:hypothetical protein
MRGGALERAIVARRCSAGYSVTDGSRMVPIPLPLRELSATA